VQTNNSQLIASVPTFEKTGLIARSRCTGTEMTLQDHVSSFLRSKHHWPYCDECIREAIASIYGEDVSLDEIRREIDGMKDRFGFHSDIAAVCTGCGDRKSTIMAL